MKVTTHPGRIGSGMTIATTEHLWEMKKRYPTRRIVFSSKPVGADYKPLTPRGFLSLLEELK